MDPIERMESATEVAAAAVSKVESGQLSQPTPCAELDVQGLLRHMIGGLQMLTVAARGDKAVVPEGDIVGADPGRSYLEARATLLEAVKAPGALERTWQMPFGDLPGSMMASIAFMEHLTHAWDVMKATGQDATLPEDLATECMEVVEPMDAMLRMPGVCGPAVEVPDDAPITDRLVAFLGRQP